MFRSTSVWLAAVVVVGGYAARGGAAEKAGPASSWKYVAEPAEGAFVRPVLRGVSLSAEKPDPMSETVKYRGRRQRYAQLRYGTEDSTRVIVVVDEISRTAFDLYVDRNRNRIIESRDLVKGTGRYRTTPLNVEIVEGVKVKHVPRSGTFRRGIARDRIAFGTNGYVEGLAKLAGRQVTVRRVDGDGNGFFSNGSDRLWIDLNSDGKWDAISEQLPYLPVLRLMDRRFAVRADRLGRRLRFDEIVGVGRLTVSLPSLAKGARLKHLEVMFVGNDGSAFSLRGEKTHVTVPVGRYALESVSLSVLDGKSPDAWNFVFSRSGGVKPQTWYDVRKDGTVTVNPIGKFRFELRIDDKKTYRPGESLAITPRLYTGDGLLINSSTCGDADRYSSEDKHNCTQIRLVTTGKSVLGTTQSGFA